MKRISRIVLCILFLSLAGIAFAASVTRGPYLQIGTQSSMIVKWRTDVATNSRVRYGLDPAALNSFKDVATNTTEHEVPLTGLLANTKYYYTIGTTTTVLAG